MSCLAECLVPRLGIQERMHGHGPSSDYVQEEGAGQAKRMQCLTQLETDFRLIPKGCPAPCPFLSAPHVDREKVPLARGRHPEQEPQAPYNQPLTRSYQQRYSTWPAMPLSRATILAGSRLPLPAAAKPPLPFPTSSVQLCPCLPVSSTASTIPLQGDHQLPLPSLPSLQLPPPPSLSRGLLPLPDTGCD